MATHKVRAADKMSHAGILQTLEQVQNTAVLSQRAKQLMTSVSVFQEYTSKKTMWKAGEPAEFGALILSGLVEIIRPTGTTGDYLVGFFGPGDVIGMSALVKHRFYPGTSKIVSSRASVLKLHLKPILSLKDVDSLEIKNWVQDQVLNHEQILREKIDILSAGSVEKRVFELICHLSRRFGIKTHDNEMETPIKLTRSQVGRIIGARVETVIRLINRWEKHGLLTWSKEGIRITDIKEFKKSVK